ILPSRSIPSARGCRACSARGSSMQGATVLLRRLRPQTARVRLAVGDPAADAFRDVPADSPRLVFVSSQDRLAIGFFFFTDTAAADIYTSLFRGSAALA